MRHVWSTEANGFGCEHLFALQKFPGIREINREFLLLPYGLRRAAARRGLPALFVCRGASDARKTARRAPPAFFRVATYFGMLRLSA